MNYCQQCRNPVDSPCTLIVEVHDAQTLLAQTRVFFLHRVCGELSATKYVGALRSTYAPPVDITWRLEGHILT